MIIRRKNVWFATEEAYKQDSQLPDGRMVKDDIVYFGLVQRLDEEWGYFLKIPNRKYET
jgi:hypothetical protein